MTTVVWFRDDLRIADHPALAAAADDPGGVVCVYVLDEASAGIRPLGGAARWWLHHSLTALTVSLAELGATLVLRRGPAGEEVPRVAAEAGADRVLWNRRYGGAEREVDAVLKRGLRDAGLAADSFPGGLLHEPWTITTKEGGPYRVYSPFWRACLAAPPPARPLDAPDSLRDAAGTVHSDRLDDWALLPTRPDWAGGLAETWQPGEAAALERLETFLDERVDDYADDRDVPAIDATSNLSPHLRWGELSPRTVWHRATEPGPASAAFLGELGWREFAWHTLFHAPDLAERNLDRRFDAFEWAEPDEELVGAWQRGETGFPLVDAGMRELWRTGAMHNRVRMVTASFLTKNLLTDWRVGERWFWDTLVDADQASNPFNWQWVAGCGADAAPYFRIFNPLLQEKKFDPEGRYVGRWAPDSAGRMPIVELPFTRERALAAYARIRGS
ncbi:DNA photolyase family protein [Agromyces mediolanus]|uniref:cryptochrome/photolyase family protein n=1 Tax=Agromyces mediolanus TaxID=41986 RepID=UPI00203DDB45|nr:deoxyribodipyrimidine photo-lyase [Agromyces mediolanus]MCM3657266.1 DNA photolyase family protein [Agromyces mediolanus]